VSEKRPRGGNSFAGQAVEASAGAWLVYGRLLPLASNPTSLLKPIEHSIDGRSSPARRLHDRPAVYGHVVIEGLYQCFEHIKGRLRNAFYSCHTLIVAR
jgi:hypothetical protein